MPSLLKGKSTFFTGAGLSPPGAPPHEKAVTFRGVVAFPRRYRFAGAPFLFWEVVIHAGGRCSSGRSSLMRAVVAHAGGHCSSGHRMPFRDVAVFRIAVTLPATAAPPGGRRLSVSGASICGRGSGTARLPQCGRHQFSPSDPGRRWYAPRAECGRARGR